MTPAMHGGPDFSRYDLSNEISSHIPSMLRIVTFGEIVRAFENQEFSIAEANHRNWGWTPARREAWLRSVILAGSPAGQIVFAERTTGRRTDLALIDGTQRVRAVLAYVYGENTFDPGYELADADTRCAFDSIPFAEWRCSTAGIEEEVALWTSFHSRYFPAVSA